MVKMPASRTRLNSEPNVLQVVAHLPLTEAFWTRVTKLLEYELAAYKLDSQAPEHRSTDPLVEHPVPIGQGDVWAYMKDHIGPVINALRSLYHLGDEIERGGGIPPEYLMSVPRIGFLGRLQSVNPNAKKWLLKRRIL